MKVYISGISGTGMGPLAIMAKEAGLEVFGSDLRKGAVYDELIKAGIEVKIGEQDGEFLCERIKEGVEWFVYTSALPETAPELVAAREAGIRVSKRDNLTEFLVQKLGLKMVAVAGTHGKTTTTSMIIWAALKMGLPAAYIVGTTLGFAPSGAYKKEDKYFIYEADEYDRNFLKFHPWLSVITNATYDHPDIYKTPEEYKQAFLQFMGQSENVIGAMHGLYDEQFTENGEGLGATSGSESRANEDSAILKEKKPGLNENGTIFEAEEFTLAGEVRREDAAMASTAALKMMQDEAEGRGEDIFVDMNEIIRIMNEFPGVGRRFERIADGIYTDYAHHPEEIKATMDVALDEMDLKKKKGVVAIYQPHQNTRQHEVQDLYYDAFIGAEKIFWLPTYLTRENPELPIILPSDLIQGLSNAEVAEEAEINEELWQRIEEYRDAGYLILLMTAGPADEWLRERASRNI